MRTRAAGHHVRLLDVGDVEQVAQVLAASFDRPWSPQAILEELESAGRRYFGVFVEGELAGVVGTADLAGEWNVMTVAVRPDQRRQGLATRLMREVLDAADHQSAAVTLEVRAGDDATRQLYAGLGFETVGQRPGYYRDEAAVLMTRQAA